mgnify:CR=1 FL=1
MKNVVMGTAGHIDHGKTSLVKRLTGIDTDRLEEEKRRGMTIELGFAPLILPSGNVISIIDVPGHEKFVKTMVAGVTGIDFVMLVVAADEGVMPQTAEHLDILSLLGVRAGVVALTKADLVDDEWLELVREDVRKAVDRTTLKGIPIIPVSSVTGYGIDKLLESLEKLSLRASESVVRELFRMPVDRIFTMTGYGTVITGTVAGGRISRSDTVEVLPSGLTARVRGIQVHNRNVDFASAGDRCALNLSGIEKENIERGDLVASPGIIKPTGAVDAVLYTVEGKEGISHNQRVHVHIGTKEALARIRILGAEKIPGGSKGYVQIRFEEPVAVLRDDRFIIRSYSPLSTLGGGRVIFHSPPNRQRFLKENIEALTIGEAGSLRELVNFILESSGKMLGVDDLWRELFIERDDIQKVLNDEIEKGNIVCLKANDKYLSKNLYADLYKKINIEFDRLYKKYTYRYQIDREEIKSRVFNNMDSKDFAAVMNSFFEDNLFELKDNFIMQPDKIAILKISGMKQTAMVEKAIYEDGLNPRNNSKLKQDLQMEVPEIEEIEQFLIQTGKIMDLGNDILIHYDTFKNSVKKIRSILDEQTGVSVGQIRDSLAVGRKMAVALLEYMDGIGITQRTDDVRKPGVHYMDCFI